MKALSRRLLIWALSLLILAPVCCAAGSQGQGKDLPAEVIRVGLYYGAEAKPEVRLETNAELGYRFGFYDEERALHVIGYTGIQNVVVVPNMTAALESGDVGGYHLRLPAAFDSFDEASENARNNGGFPAFCNGEFCVMYGSYPTPELAQEALQAFGREAEIYSDSGRGVLVLPEDSTDPLFLFDYSSTHALVLSAHDPDTKPVTSCFGTQYYGDFQFNRVANNGLTVVNCVYLEDYVKGILPNEMSSDWPVEALKAQAVCARTYALKNLNSYRIFGFDVADDTTSQVYRGLRDANATTDAACEATAGEVLRYQGELCAVYYFAADGGATESAEFVWNDVAIPYLRATADPYEQELDFYCKTWSAYASADAVGQLSAEYGDNGIVRSVSFGGKTYRNDLVREFLAQIGAPYNSRMFKINYLEDTDSYRISGYGFGHNLGMSQWGAFAMAKNHDLNYQDILAFYFNGATVS